MLPFFCTKYDYLNTKGRALHFEEIQHLGGHVKLKVLGTGNRFVTKERKKYLWAKERISISIYQYEFIFICIFVFVVATHLYVIYYIKDVNVML